MPDMDRSRTRRGYQARHAGPGRGALRDVPGRRAALWTLLALLTAALLVPLLLLTSLTGGSPARFRTDPAVIALQTYQSGKDGSPRLQQAAREAAKTLNFVTLADGATRASRVGRQGQCFYLLLPADGSVDSRGIIVGQPSDCH